MYQIGLSVLIVLNETQMVQDDTGWFEMVPGGYQVVPGGTRWCQVVPGGARLCHVVPGGARWCQVVPCHVVSGLLALLGLVVLVGLVALWWVLWADIIKSIKRLIADPKVPAIKARISRQKCHLRQNSINCEM